MNPVLKKNLALLFLVLLAPLTGMAVLSIWDVLTEDVMWRAIATVVVLGGATALAMAVLSAVDVEGVKSKKK